MSNTPATPETLPAKPLPYLPGPWAARLIHLLTILLAAIAAVLAIGDKVTALPLPPDWVKWWGVFAGAAIAARPVILLIGDILDNGVVDNSFKALAFLAAIALGLSGCSGIGSVSGSVGLTDARSGMGATVAGTVVLRDRSKDALFPLPKR